MKTTGCHRDATTLRPGRLKPVWTPDYSLGGTFLAPYRPALNKNETQKPMGNPQDKIRCLSSWNDLEGLTPLENRWLRKYTKPSVAVILEEWTRDLPMNFDLEYLLAHAIDSKWDLTEEGWKKAEEFGILAPLEKSHEELSADDNDDANWLTHGDAAKQLSKFTQMDFKNLKSRITKMGQKGKLTTNGKTGREIRFLKSDINALELKLRNIGLDDNPDLDDSDDD